MAIFNDWIEHDFQELCFGGLVEIGERLRDATALRQHRGEWDEWVAGAHVNSVASYEGNRRQSPPGRRVGPRPMKMAKAWALVASTVDWQ